ncbi:intraflagellar transport protein 57 homolog [Dysidea avara]|uniref:intraflagellar transport protein 57 homolog n=1 Tax=Dysidea avara TaxID=196820 RepID=UPI00332EA82A
MDEEDNTRVEAASNPQLVHLVFLKMEDLMDGLKLLNYEREFCKQFKFKPFPRHYFAISTNPGEQFYAFTNLAAWLITVCGHGMEQPQEYDDPNATISTILEESKKLGIPTSFPPAKLKPGCGEQVCSLLNNLVERALDSSHFKWKRPMHKEEKFEEEILEEDEAEVNLSKLDEEVLEDEVEADFEEGDAFLDLSEVKEFGIKEGSSVGKLDDMLESTFDITEWRMEVERVLPALKIFTRPDNKDWRSHYDQMHQYSSGIDNSLSQTKLHLDKLYQEISKTLEKISSREKYINSQLEHQITEYRLTQNKLAAAKERYQQGSSSVNDLSRELAQLTEELETVKAQMDERGTSMTDSGPLVRIKQAMTKLKNECTQMELRIGVVEHTLLMATLKHKDNMQMEMNNIVPSNY